MPMLRSQSTYVHSGELRALSRAEVGNCRPLSQQHTVSSPLHLSICHSRNETTRMSFLTLMDVVKPYSRWGGAVVAVLSRMQS